MIHSLIYLFNDELAFDRAVGGKKEIVCISDLEKPLR